MSEVIYFIVTVLEALLVFRVAFKFFNVAVTTSIVHWVYDLTDPLIRPFQNIFHVTYVGSGYAIDWTTVLALIVYGVAGYLLAWLIQILTIRYRK
jgi:uncharacterized protein YggT (Ycf19 family)